MMMKILLLTGFATSLAGKSRAAALYQPPNASQPSCRCFPGDSCWPSPAQWSSFNASLGGKLVATVPVASPCHDTFPGVRYNSEACAAVQAGWDDPMLHDVSSSSPMAPIFANMSCDPFTGIDAPCQIGAYVPYAVNASDISDYTATLAFAKEYDIRLVIRNTGHDYLGKSTGAGAIALWTHHLKNIEIFDYKDSNYVGKAMRMGAGVQALEAQAAANKEGLIVVQGDCMTIGLAGGYTQGGGTSPLSSILGLAADSVLEWEVVTAGGDLLKATGNGENTDLYWALSGGGGGTYGAVWSMTVKLYPDMPTAGASLSFTAPLNSSSYWNVIEGFLMNLPTYQDAGAAAYWQILPGNVFSLPQAFLPNGTAQDLENLLSPTLLLLNQSDISYKFTSADFPTFQEAFYTLNPSMPIQKLNIGGRLIPQTLVESKSAAASLIGALKHILNNNGLLAGVSMSPREQPQVPNSVNPYWRETIFLAFYGIAYDPANLTANLVAQENITNIISPVLEALTPNGAAYLNEADYNQPNWQDVFYGENYERLISIKNKYDPYDLFWGKTAVGSEGWGLKRDGRLCRVSREI